MAKLRVNTLGDTSEMRLFYETEIDGIAESTRLRYITAGAGQSMSYDAKYAQAIAYRDGHNEGEYKWLTAEAEATDSTVENVVNSIIKAREIWEAIGVTIEASRLKAKLALTKVDSASDMQKILSDFKKEMELLPPR